MVNPLLSEYHVWSASNGRSPYYVVDTYYQEIVSEHATMKVAFEEVRALRTKQRGEYPSIVEA